jgi:hypothetical protein
MSYPIGENSEKIEVIRNNSSITQSTQFFTLNLKILFSEAGKKNEVENSSYFERYVFFKKMTSFRLFVFFDPKEAFAGAKK